MRVYSVSVTPSIPKYLLHDQPGIHGFQGIRDDGFTCCVLDRRNVGCPENRSNVDKEGGIRHMAPKTNPVIKGRDYENTWDRSHRSYYLGPKPCP